MAGKWAQVGAIWCKKDDKKAKRIVLKKADSVELIERLKSGDVTLFYEKATAKFDRFLAGGHITEEEYTTKVDNLPETLCFEINLPPEQD